MIRLIFKTEGARILEYSTLEICIPKVEEILKKGIPGVGGYTVTRLIGAEVVQKMVSSGKPKRGEKK